MKKNTLALVLIAALALVGCNMGGNGVLPPPVDEEKAPEGYATVDSNTTLDDVKALLENPDVDGIWAEEPITFETAEPVALDRSFGMENVTFKAPLSETKSRATAYPLPDGKTGSTHAIDITPNSDNSTIEITLKNVHFENYSHAISVADKSNVNLTITDSTFENCFKGIYAEGLGNLTINNVTMNNMGVGSVAGEGSEEARMDRSGAGIDINQTSTGGAISITNSHFTNCGGGANATDENGGKLTSGAIKIKVRQEADYKTGANGSFTSVTIMGNTFDNNRKDVVLGTSGVATTDEAKEATYPSDLAENTTIQNCELEDNSTNGYTISGNKLEVPKSSEIIEGIYKN